MFYSAFQDHFIPWSMREENHLRFEILVHGSLSMTEYEVHFCEISRHTLTIILDKAERVHWFVRVLTFFVKPYVFRVVRERASFRSIVNIAK